MMKIRYPIIAIVALIIAQIAIGNLQPYPVWFDTVSATIFILIVFCLGLIMYLIIRNIFRAIKGAVTGTPTGDYRSEARRACEKVTPKRKQNVTPPWEQ